MKIDLKSVKIGNSEVEVIKKLAGPLEVSDGIVDISKLNLTIKANDLQEQDGEMRMTLVFSTGTATPKVTSNAE